MKRIFALLLTVFMVLSLAACNKAPDVMFEVDTNSTSATESNNVFPSLTVDENLTEESTITTETLPTAETLPTEENSSTEEKEFALGVVDGNTYKNAFAGITFVADSNWHYYTEKEIRELNNFASDLAGEEYKNAVEKATLLYDMFVTKDDNSQNVNIIFQKCAPSVLENFDSKKFFETTFSTTKESLMNIGAKSVNHEIGEIEMGDKKFDCLFLTSTYDSTTLYQAQVAVVRGEYLATISLSAKSSKDLQEIANNFKFE